MKFKNVSEGIAAEELLSLGADFYRNHMFPWSLKEVDFYIPSMKAALFLDGSMHDFKASASEKGCIFRDSLAAAGYAVVVMKNVSAKEAFVKEVVRRILAGEFKPGFKYVCNDTPERKRYSVALAAEQGEIP